MTLDLDVERAVEDAVEAGKPVAGEIVLAVGERTHDRSRGAARQRDEAFGVGFDGVDLDVGGVGRLGFEEGLARELDEVLIAPLILGKEGEVAAASSAARSVRGGRGAGCGRTVAEIGVEGTTTIGWMPEAESLSENSRRRRGCSCRKGRWRA